MNSCCLRPSPPLVLHPLQLESSRKAEASANPRPELLDVPAWASTDVRVLLTNLRDRQEQLFEQVLDQKKVFQSQLVAIQSHMQAISTAKENFMAEFQDSFSKVTETDVHGEANQEVAKVDIAENVISPSAAAISESEASGQKRKDNLETYDESERISSHRSTLRKSLARTQSVYLEDSKGPLQYLSRILHSTKFEMTIATAIMLNAFIMCWETQYQGLDVGFNLQYPGRQVEAHVAWAGAESVFNYFDWFFGCLFLTEMLLKMVCWRLSYFFRAPSHRQSASGLFEGQSVLQKSQGWELACMQHLKNHLLSVKLWNLLDFVTVMVFLFDKIAAAGFVNPQTIRLLRVFRLGRLVRLLRYLENLDHLYVMTTAISGLKVVLTWGTLLLTLMLLICDLFLVQMLQATYFDQVKASDLTQEELRKHQQMYSYFGTCTRCMLSMFEMTLGNWPPIARLLSEEVSQWFTLVCLVHKLTIGFAVVGVITGCILQETFKVAQTDDIIMFRQKRLAAKVFKQKMTTLFEALDLSQDGLLDKDELVVTLGAAPEIKTWLASLNVETDDLRTLFDLCDMDGDGYITLDELLKRMPRIQGNARSIDVLEIRKRLSKNCPTRTDSSPNHISEAPAFAGDTTSFEDVPPTFLF